MPRLWAVLSLEGGKPRRTRPQGLGEYGCLGHRGEARQESTLYPPGSKREDQCQNIKMRISQKLRSIYNSPVSAIGVRGPGFLLKRSEQGSDSLTSPQGSPGGTILETQWQQAPAVSRPSRTERCREGSSKQQPLRSPQNQRSLSPEAGLRKPPGWSPQVGKAILP